MSVQVCVCGWYFRPGFYTSLRDVPSSFEVVVVANRPGETLGLPTVERGNTGLDWGAFARFLDRSWNGRSDVLFLQDDVEVEPAFWEDVAAIRDDQAFIFRDRAEFEVAYSHGRAHFASARFLEALKEAGGIWYDEGNRGFIAAGPSWSEQPPEGCLDHNAGIRAYTARVQAIGSAHPEMTVDRQVYSTNVHLGQRGVIERI